MKKPTLKKLALNKMTVADLKDSLGGIEPTDFTFVITCPACISIKSRCDEGCPVPDTWNVTCDPLCTELVC